MRELCASVTAKRDYNKTGHSTSCAEAVNFKSRSRGGIGPPLLEGQMETRKFHERRHVPCGATG